MKTGNLIAGAILALWGAAILIHAIVSGDTGGTDSAYSSGQLFGFLAGVAMLGVGARGVVLELRKRA